MSDRSAGFIRIGGDLRRSLIPEFIEAVRNADALPDWNGGELRNEEDILNQLKLEGDPWLVLQNYDVPGGEFEDLQSWLKNHDLPFDQHSDACVGAYDATWMFFRPGVPHVYVASDGHYSELCDFAPVLRAREALANGNVHAALTFLDDIVGDRWQVKTLPAFRIIPDVVHWRSWRKPR